MKKSELRKEYLAKRQELAEEDFVQRNQSLCENFRKIDLSKISRILVFIPIVERREVDTYLILDYLKTEHSNIQIAVPKSHPESNTLSHFLLNEHTVFERNKWGIPEPVNG